MDSFSKGEEVTVVENETVIVEGTIKRLINEDNGVNVIISESEKHDVEFWEEDSGDRVMLRRRREGERWKPVPVEEGTTLESR